MQGYEPAAQSVAALPPELTEGGHVALVMVAGLMQPLERLLLSGAPWQLAHVLRRTRAGRKTIRLLKDAEPKASQEAKPLRTPK